MPQDIIITLKSIDPIKEILESNYQDLLSKFGDLAKLPRPLSIDFFGTDSDSNQALISYPDQYKLHLFHNKYRKLLDAGFLEKSNLGCLYDADSKPISGLQLYSEDKGGIILTTAYDHELILPYMILPGNLRRLEKILSSPPYSQETVESVTKNILGSCIEEVPTAILYKLSDGSKYVTKRESNNDIMSSISLHTPLTQRFIIEYEPDLIERSLIKHS